MLPKSYASLPLSTKDVPAQPNQTYRLMPQAETIAGKTGNIDALKQAIYLILNIERYENIIFSWNYGIELKDLFGMPLPYVESELKRRISEALTQDDRIDSVDGFSFAQGRGGVLAVQFTVHSKLGSFEYETEVDLNV